MCLSLVLGALLCHYCRSSKSLEHCEKKQEQSLGCIGSKKEDVCYTFQSIGQDGTHYYGKHCIAKSKCTAKVACPRNATLCKVILFFFIITFLRIIFSGILLVILHEKCPNTEFFLVRIWALFT